MLLIPLALTLAVVGATDTGQTAAKQDSLPLKTTRTVAFETTEGTWLSLDVSPDGQTIVFELLGDIYTMPASGGTASRITSGPAFDSQPRYSPDGKRIVFLSDRSGAENVWLMNADGSLPKPLTKGETSLFVSPEWTPDGKYIVASKTEGVLGSAYTMWIWHVDGGSGSKLITDKGDGAPGASRSTTISALGAAFGPDGRYVWFSRHRGGFGYNLQFPEWELAIYDRVEGKVFPQTDTYGSAMRPVLSPDGHWLVYGTRFDAQTGLRLRDLRTGDERWLAWPVRARRPGVAIHPRPDARLRPSPRTARHSSPPGAASSGASTSPPEMPRKFRSRRRSSSSWAHWFASRTGWIPGWSRSSRSGIRHCRPTGSAIDVQRARPGLRDGLPLGASTPADFQQRA